MLKAADVAPLLGISQRAVVEVGLAAVAFDPPDDGPAAGVQVGHCGVRLRVVVWPK